MSPPAWAIKNIMSKEKSFCRKHPMPGVYGIRWKDQSIEIKDREIFTTDDQELIEVFKNDPEIMEYAAPEAEEGTDEIIVYEDMKKEELLRMCKTRGLCKEDVGPKDVLKDDLVNMLEEFDQTNSSPADDQGEQAPE